MEGGEGKVSSLHACIGQGYGLPLSHCTHTSGNRAGTVRFASCWLLAAGCLAFIYWLCTRKQISKPLIHLSHGKHIVAGQSGRPCYSP